MMRAGGINWMAVLAAAVAFYALGFVIYGMIIPEETFMAWSGMTPAELEGVGTERMPFGALMPLATAAFLAILFKWGGVDSAAKGARWAMLVAGASAIPAVWYGWVYGVGPVEGPVLDSVHLLLGHGIAGAILGRWR
jgi:predicted membrane channel-forming protein YqfA (hemolysin III family)